MHKYVARHGAGEYLVPALAGVNLTLTLTLLAALSIVREVERGTWHGLLTTPAGAAAIVLGKLASYFVFGLLLFAALTALAAALFDTPLNGLALWLAAALFMTAKPGAWSGDLAAGTHADAGHADGRVLLPAFDPAVGFHVPVSRHAGLGARHWRGSAPDALPALPACEPAPRCRCRHGSGAGLAGGAVCLARAADGDLGRVSARLRTVQR